MKTAMFVRKIRTGTAVFTVCLVIHLSAMLLSASDVHNDSERIIREAVGKQLNKDPNKLKDEDFSKITELDLSMKNFSRFKPA